MGPSSHSSVYVFMSDTLNVTPECIALGVHSKAVARIFVWGIALPFLPSPPHPFPPPPLPFPPPFGGPLPHYELGVLGERCKFPQRGPPQTHFCGSETYLVAAILLLC